MIVNETTYDLNYSVASSVVSSVVSSVFKNESPAYWEEFEMTEPHQNNQPIHLCYKGSASLPKSNTVNNTRRLSTYQQ